MVRVARLIVVYRRFCATWSFSGNRPAPASGMMTWSNSSPFANGSVRASTPEDGSRPAGLFSGYLADPERDAQAWAGGVYHTGDAAWQTADGSYWFHGRFDDIIKTGGYRVGPGEIESVLMEHPAVLECSVVGVPDPLRGQAIQAVVVLTTGQEAGPTLEREIRDFCNQKLAAYKWVRQVKFVEALPKTISGKIRRHTLRVP